MSQRDRLLLIVALVVGGLAGSWFFVVQPKREQVAAIEGQITTARGQLAGTAGLAAQYRASRDSLRKHPEVFERAGRALPGRVAMPDLLRTLTRNARGTGVKLGDFSASEGGDAGTTPGIGSVGLSLSFTGDFLSLQRYLARLQRTVAVSAKTVEAKGRLVALNSVELTPGENGKLGAKVSATVYVMQPGALAPTAAAAPAEGAPASTTTPTAAGGS